MLSGFSPVCPPGFSAICPFPPRWGSPGRGERALLTMWARPWLPRRVFTGGAVASLRGSAERGLSPLPHCRQDPGWCICAVMNRLRGAVVNRLRRWLARRPVGRANVRRARVRALAVLLVTAAAAQLRTGRRGHSHGGASRRPAAPADAVVSVGHVLNYLPDEPAIDQALTAMPGRCGPAACSPSTSATLSTARPSATRRTPVSSATTGRSSPGSRCPHPTGSCARAPPLCPTMTGPGAATTRPTTTC